MLEHGLAMRHVKAEDVFLVHPPTETGGDDGACAHAGDQVKVICQRKTGVLEVAAPQLLHAHEHLKTEDAPECRRRPVKE